MLVCLCAHLPSLVVNCHLWSHNLRCLFCQLFYFISSKWCSQICCSFITAIALIFIPCNLHECFGIYIHEVKWKRVAMTKHYKHTHTQNYDVCRKTCDWTNVSMGVNMRESYCESRAKQYLTKFQWNHLTSRFTSRFAWISQIETIFLVLSLNLANLFQV